MMVLKVLGPIDKGGFGNVDLVEDDTGLQFARKTFSKNQPLSDELLENVKKRFAKEVRIQKAMTHPNIVPIVSESLDADPPYYLMPVASSSLSKDLAKDRQLGGKFVSAFSDIVAALEEMHAMQIYHRDLKPQNVLRFPGPGGDPYYAVSDFGLISIKESQLSALTTTGMARQSDYYTAPEITKDLRMASIQSDIYSLGCILHDMVGTEDRVPCGEIREPGDFAGILLGCTRKDPKQRFKSAKAVLDAVVSVDFATAAPTAQASIDFAKLLDGEQALNAEFWERLSEHLEHNSSGVDRAIILSKINTPRIRELLAFQESAIPIALQYAKWIAESAFNFESCDGLANRLVEFLQLTDFESKVACLLALLELGISHNRWYVERLFVSHCDASMDLQLAKRLAIQMRIEGDGICRSIARLEGSIDVSRADLHPELVKALVEVCA